MVVTLRDYQVRVLEAARAEMRRGKRRIIIQAATGAGKGRIAGELARCAHAKDTKTLILADRRKLISQLAGNLTDVGVPYGVIMSGETCRTREGVIVASRDTLKGWIGNPDMPLPDPGLILIDECFVAGTMIDTPGGRRPIESIIVGDKVANAFGFGTVLGTSNRKPTDIYKVRLSDGTEIRCTGNHPIFTDRGWVKASVLEEHSVVYGLESVLELRGRFQATENEERPKNRHRRGPVESDEVLFDILLEEKQQPDGRPCHAGADGTDPEDDRAQAASSRREWQADAGVPKAFAGSPRGWMGVGSGCANQSTEGERLPDLLQDRHCEQVADDCHRGGRDVAQPTVPSVAGQEEAGVAGVLRVVSVSRDECRSDEVVFNLHVSGHPSYFANGILVHNCHLSMGEGFQFILSKFPKAFVVGFTATPCRNDGKALEDFWQSLVCAEKPSELIRRGFLVKPTVYQPPELAAKRASGEKTRGLAGDPVSTWVRNADGLPTIAACRSVAESLELMRRFVAAGIPAEHVDADASDDERDAKYRRLQTGETKVLCSVKLLITGIDIPEVACGIVWCPMGSLTELLQFGGRFMRPAAGKSKCVLLDFSGACEFHKVEPGDDIEWSLDPAKSVQERIAADLEASPEKKKLTCPKCGLMFKSAPACPACGHSLKQKQVRQRAGAASEGYEATDEVLVKREASQAANLTAERMQRAWTKALYIAKAKGGRAAMAIHLFKSNPDSGGKTPWDAGVKPLPDGDWKIAAKDLLDMARAGA